MYIMFVAHAHPNFFCCVISLNECTRVCYGLHMVYFIMVNLITKLHDSCFGFMCRVVASGKGYLYSKALSPLRNEMENLIFSNDKLFHVYFPLDVPTFRALKLFHAQVFLCKHQDLYQSRMLIGKKIIDFA